MVLTLRLRFFLSLTGALLLTSLLVLLSTPHHHSQLTTFWLHDLPPLTPLLRILTYTGVLLISLSSFISRPPFGDSPLQAPELFAFTLPSFFSLEGAMRLIGGRWITHGRLRLLRGVMLVAWVCCIVGLGGRVPGVVVGLLHFLLHGVVSGCIGTSHRWYVPVYTLLALMFADGNQALSLDSVIHSHYPSYPLYSHSSSSPSTVSGSGLARKLVLIASISTLFYGGLTKLLNGGWKWLNGRSLAYYVSSEENGRWGLLKRVMSSQPLLSLFLSVSSIVLECGAIVAVFSRFWRPIVLANAAAFHFGIWLTMWPNYLPQTWCYGVGTQWPWEELPAYPALVPPQWATSHQPTFLLPHWPAYFHSTPFWACWAATLLCVFLTFVTLFRIEYWPLTGIPMYSFYRDNSFSYRFLRDERQAQFVAVEHVHSGYPNALAWSNLWIILRLKNTDPRVRHEIAEARRRRKVEKLQQRPAALAVGGAKRPWRSLLDPPGVGEGVGSIDDPDERWYVNLKGRVTKEGAVRGVLTKQWRRTLHNVAAADMAAKPVGRIHAPKEGEGARIDAEESEGEVGVEGMGGGGVTGGWEGRDEEEAEADVEGEGEGETEEAEGEGVVRRRRKGGSVGGVGVDPSLAATGSSPRPSPRPVYPGEAWLLKQRDGLRMYAEECEWKLPEWAEATGELQLRCKLRHGYAVLARCPWNPAKQQ